MEKSYFETIKERMVRAASYTNWCRRDNDVNRNHTNYGACTAWAQLLDDDMYHRVHVAVYEEDGFLLIPSITIDGEVIRFFSVKKRNTNDPIENMKELIERYCEAEFGPEDQPDFSNMKEVLLATAQTKDKKHVVTVAADLIGHRLIRKIDRIEESIKAWGTTESFTEDCLKRLDFTELTTVSDEAIEQVERTQRKNNYVED